MAKRFLLDTHVVIELSFAGGLEAMPTTVQRILEDRDVELLLSVVSEAEVEIKSRIGKLAMTKAELELVCSNAFIGSHPLQRSHISHLFELPLHHADPFDRLIISTALSDDLPLISRDQRFQKYRGLQVVW